MRRQGRLRLGSSHPDGTDETDGAGIRSEHTSSRPPSSTGSKRHSQPRSARYSHSASHSAPRTTPAARLEFPAPGDPPARGTGQRPIGVPLWMFSRPRSARRNPGSRAASARPSSLVWNPSSHRARNIKGGSHDQAARDIGRSGGLGPPTRHGPDSARDTLFGSGPAGLGLMLPTLMPSSAVIRSRLPLGPAGCRGRRGWGSTSLRPTAHRRPHRGAESGSPYVHASLTRPSWVDDDR